MKIAVKKRLEGWTLDVDLTLEPGRITALVGPSGAGKTTLLHVIAGLLPPDEGQVVLGEQAWTAEVPPQERGAGVVFRPPALFPHLTARANVAFGAEDPALVERLLDRFELLAFAERFPRQLSAGEQQRVAIARALAMRPRVLLLDEPFTALDPALARRLYEALREEALGLPVLLVTHDLTEAAWLADRLGVLSAGRLLQLGPTAEVLARPTSPEVARTVGFANVERGELRDGWLHWGRYRVAPAAGEGPVGWAIRAEQIVVHDQSAPQTLPGSLRRLAALPGGWRALVDVPGAGLLEAAGQTMPRLAVGDPVWLGLPADALVLMGG